MTPVREWMETIGVIHGLCFNDARAREVEKLGEVRLKSESSEKAPMRGHVVTVGASCHTLEYEQRAGR